MSKELPQIPYEISVGKKKALFETRHSYSLHEAEK